LRHEGRADELVDGIVGFEEGEFLEGGQISEEFVTGASLAMIDKRHEYDRSDDNMHTTGAGHPI